MKQEWGKASKDTRKLDMSMKATYHRRNLIVKVNSLVPDPIELFPVLFDAFQVSLKLIIGFCVWLSSYYVLDCCYPSKIFTISA